MTKNKVKHSVHYDSSGRIEALIAVSAPHGINAGLTPKPGLLAAEIEGLDLGAGAPDVEAFRNLVKDHQVSGQTARMTLKKK